MNKNLKKVISSVAALSMVASSVAAFAAQFPDVTEDAYYASAVQELSALDVISGFEDGTFKPDELVTRAQITKMIVDALGEGSIASASVNTTSFTDVAAGASGHWAVGYINQGVSDGWISGMGDGTFAPDANVSYVQAQKMLVAATGYDIYAQAQPGGGWPAGYKTYANQLKITSGVQGADNDDTQLTRAQVAKMIDNAMDAPLCKVVNYEYSLNGTRVPVLDVMDGEGKDYQTLFTEKHDAYKVYGRVTATSKSGGSSLDPDEVDFRVEKADNFDDEYVKASEERDAETMNIGESGADKYLNTYAQALIQKNDDDEFVILSIAPAASNKTVSLAAEDYDKVDGNTLYFYPAGSNRNSVKYKMADTIKFYRNGVEDTSVTTVAKVAALIDGDETSSITLQKTTNYGTTASASEYDVVMMSTYATAIVDEVVEKSDEISVRFDDASSTIGENKMTVDLEDETKSYSFKLDGAEIKATDLQENDVLSIAFDMSGEFGKSEFYDVLVSRDTAEGRCTSKTSKVPVEYTVGGTKYKVAEGMEITLETASDYTLYLDHFGRIAKQDESANSSKKLGILDGMYVKASGGVVAEVITNEAKKVEYNVDKTDAVEYAKLVFKTAPATLDDIDNNDAKLDIQDRVINYTVSGSNKLTIKKTNNEIAAEEIKGESSSDDEFKASTLRLGDIKMNDATVIVDVSDYVESNFEDDEFKVVAPSALSEGSAYVAYGYNKSTDGICRFVVITEGDNGYGVDTQLAVFVGSETTTVGDDDNRMAYELAYNNEVQKFVLKEGSEYDADSFEEGDVVVFKTNASNEIEEIKAVLTGQFNDSDYPTFDSFAKTGSAEVLKTAITELEINDENIAELFGDDEDVEVIFGAILNKNGSTYTIGQINVVEGEAHTTLSTKKSLGADVKAYDVTVGSDSKVYAYDFGVNANRQSRVLVDQAVSYNKVPNAAHIGDKDSDDINLSHEEVEDIVYCVARVINNDVQEMVMVIPD